MAGLTRHRLQCGKKSVFLPIVGVIFLLSQLAVGDIHRAKTHTGKVAPYPYRENSDVDGEAVAAGAGDASGLFSDFEAGSKSEGLEAWMCALLATTLVGMTGIFPLLLPIDVGPDIHNNGDGAARFKCLLSFAVGGLLGDVFLHLMPEAWSHVDQDDHSGQMRIGVWVLAGIFAFLVLEKMFGDNENNQQESKGNEESLEHSQTGMYTMLLPSEKNGHATILSKNKPKSRKRRKTPENGRSKGGGGGVANGLTANGHNFSQAGPLTTTGHQKVNNKETKVKVTGYLNLLANFIDNFTHGLAVAGSFLVSNKVGLLTTAAILLHEVPHEIGDFAILLRSGFNRWQAAKAQVFTATGGLCGALLALMSESAEKAGDSAAWILPFTSGGFLNIALVTVLPDLLQETNPRESVKQVVCLLCGIAVMGAVNLIVD